MDEVLQRFRSLHVFDSRTTPVYVHNTCISAVRWFQTICKDFLKSSSYVPSVSCKLFLFLSSLSAFSAHYYLPASAARQSKSQRGRRIKSQRGRRIKSQTRQAHQKPARLPAARRIIEKRESKGQTFFQFSFISSYSGCSVPPPGRDNVLPPSQSLASLFLS